MPPIDTALLGVNAGAGANANAGGARTGAKRVRTENVDPHFSGAKQNRCGSYADADADADGHADADANTDGAPVPDRASAASMRESATRRLLQVCDEAVSEAMGNGEFIYAHARPVAESAVPRLRAHMARRGARVEIESRHRHALVLVEIVWG